MAKKRKRKTGEFEGATCCRCGLDLDPENLPRARERLAGLGLPFALHHSNFAGLPAVLADRFAKGRKDCGQHDWYNADDVVDHCYHCTVGVRRRQS